MAAKDKTRNTIMDLANRSSAWANPGKKKILEERR